jgi:hypothetical protein
MTPITTGEDGTLYTLISYPSGVILKGLIVKGGRNRRRVLAEGLGDALDLRRAGAQWLTNEGKRVDFLFVGTNPWFIRGAASATEPCRWVC